MATCDYFKKPPTDNPFRLLQGEFSTKEPMLEASKLFQAFVDKRMEEIRDYHGKMRLFGGTDTASNDALSDYMVWRERGGKYTNE